MVQLKRVNKDQCTYVQLPDKTLSLSSIADLQCFPGMVRVIVKYLHGATQMVELKRVIDEDQRTYVQWAEEKLSLANIAADLLIQHRTAVDKDVGALLAELKVRHFTHHGDQLG